MITTPKLTQRLSRRTELRRAKQRTECQAGRRLIHELLESRVVLSATYLISDLGTLPGTDSSAAVDINPHKQGYFMPGTGHEVLAPETLVERGIDVVVVMNPIYVEEIRSQLAGLGLNPEIVPA